MGAGTDAGGEASDESSRANETPEQGVMITMMVDVTLMTNSIVMAMMMTVIATRVAHRATSTNDKGGGYDDDGW